MMRCLVTDRTFTEYAYQSVSWSGDQLPVCPHCRETPYDVEFNLRHELFVTVEQLIEPAQKGGA